MENETRQIVITANWKMYKTVEEALVFVKGLLPLLENVQDLVYIAVPFTAIKSVTDVAKGSKLVVGAQNMNDASEGAFTGEIAARMLVDSGAKFVILGHSERRRQFQESNEWINRKMKRAIKESLQPTLCIGENFEEREKGQTQDVLQSQLIQCLEGVNADEVQRCIIAYEPVWAIGNGMTAQPELVQDVHAFCRGIIKEKWGEMAAQKVTIQYGGSVKPENAADLMNMPDIDGLLVGSASLSLESFIKIVNFRTQNSQHYVGKNL